VIPAGITAVKFEGGHTACHSFETAPNLQVSAIYLDENGHGKIRRKRNGNENKT